MCVQTAEPLRSGRPWQTTVSMLYSMMLNWHVTYMCSAYDVHESLHMYDLVQGLVIVASNASRFYINVLLARAQNGD